MSAEALTVDAAISGYREAKVSKGQLIAASTFKYTSVLTMVAVLYLVMSVPLILFVGWLERRMQRARS